jgi:short subunit dehydrogenase-like uncharacterized protein
VVIRVREQLDPSGGTIESIMSKLTIPPDVKKAAQGAYFLSPLAGRFAVPCPATNLLGLRHVPRLGTLADTTYSTAQDRAVANRTWGLLAELDSQFATPPAAAEAEAEAPPRRRRLSYGPNFHVNEYDAVASALAGAGKVAYAVVLGMLLGLVPLRAVLRGFLPAPGEGPDPDKARRGPGTELVAVAVPDGEQQDTAGVEAAAVATFRHPSGPYDITGAALAQGAASLLYRRELLGGVAGGCLTPAFLGMDLIERLRKAGAEIDVKIETADR